MDSINVLQLLWALLWFIKIAHIATVNKKLKKYFEFSQSVIFNSEQ